MLMRNRLVRDCTRLTKRKDSLWTICRPPESADQLYSMIATLISLLHLLYFYILMSWGPTGGQQTEYNT